MHTSSKVWLFFCWIAVIALAGTLRFDQLSDRPFHFDEATGARITSQRISASNSGAGYSFNPVHNHGPLLSAAAEPICKINGETSWQKMTKLSLRLVPAIAGTLLVMIPVFWRRRFGDTAMLVAAALLATSPLLVYYSRMFIHEMLLTLLGLAVVIVLFLRPKFSLTLKFAGIGGLVGLMFATKETFAISIIAWTAAGIVLAISNIRSINQHNTANNRKRLWRQYRDPAIAFLITAALSAGWYYTDGLSNLKGAWDAVRTFFVYKTTAGHDKPMLYYIGMLAVPTKGGIWWHELPVLVLALVALVRSYLPGKSHPNKHENIVRFVAYSAIIHLLIYSLISYKTPWLMCLPWAHFCLLAGLSFRGFSHWKLPVKAAATILLLGVLFQQQRLSGFAIGRFANDSRNPYAYTPTSRDVESLRAWLQELSKELPPGALEPIGVVGSEYWPLPWYLRDFESIGYWPEPAPAINGCPLVIAMPEMADAVTGQLKDTHTILPRTLRTNVPVMLYLRRDYWQQWITPDPSETP
ncbi:MAG: TIGR03663 family protein [Akkermansiaceae bacterium]|nr:TIGR03663 family protein [Akkermansiaceae bacterium]